MGLPEIYMSVFPSSFNEGIVYYSLYMKKKRPDYTLEKVYISNAEAKKAINKRNTERERVEGSLLESLGLVAGYVFMGAFAGIMLPKGIMLPQGTY